MDEWNNGKEPRRMWRKTLKSVRTFLLRHISDAMMSDSRGHRTLQTLHDSFNSFTCLPMNVCTVKLQMTKSTCRLYPVTLVKPLLERKCLKLITCSISAIHLVNIHSRCLSLRIKSVVHLRSPKFCVSKLSQYKSWTNSVSFKLNQFDVELKPKLDQLTTFQDYSRVQVRAKCWGWSVSECAHLDVNDAPFRIIVLVLLVHVIGEEEQG